MPINIDFKRWQQQQKQAQQNNKVIFLLQKKNKEIKNCWNETRKILKIKLKVLCKCFCYKILFELLKCFWKNVFEKKLFKFWIEQK